ncbi:MAG: PDZ domain-containing protein, partial [Planctomycetales bacterium]|nr:PDZ domain-containing protein [Planctomycetales bacterium]
MPVRNLQILVALMVICLACYFQAERLKYAGKLGYAIVKIKDNYVDEIDPQDLYMAAMKGMVSELDPFSEFIPPSKYEEFHSLIEQQFGGLGILIEGPPAVPQLTVVAPIPGSPAFAAGMQPGDVIERIGEQSTEGLEATEATGLMRGPIGEPVALQVKRIGVTEPLSIIIHRGDIQVDSVYGDHIRHDSSWEYLLEEDTRIAYIRITLFGEKTVSELKKALSTIKSSARAVIIDLRFNPGGLLPAAVEMCDMLLDHGTVVSTRGRNNRLIHEFRADPGLSLDPSIPMIVMINDHSASASEIMAGCLQDLGRAKVA